STVTPAIGRSPKEAKCSWLSAGTTSASHSTRSPMAVTRRSPPRRSDEAPISTPLRQRFAAGRRTSDALFDRTEQGRSSEDLDGSEARYRLPKEQDRLGIPLCLVPLGWIE